MTKRELEQARKKEEKRQEKLGLNKPLKKIELLPSSDPRVQHFAYCSYK